MPATLPAQTALSSTDCTGAGLTASPSLSPTIEERYERADRYLWDGLQKLVIDGKIPTQFIQDGDAVKGLTYRTGAVGQRDIRYVDLATGQASLLSNETALAGLVSAAVGVPIDAADLRLSDIDYDPALRTLQFSALGRRWSLDGAGSLSEAEADQGAADTAFSDESEQDAVRSPDGRFEVIAKDYNLFLRDLDTRQMVPLTTDGTRDQPYGRGIPQLADILREGTEEPDMPVAVRWSPDSRYVATWQLDTRGVKRLSMTQESPPDSFYPRSFEYIYPLAGAEKLPEGARYVIDVPAALARGQGRPKRLEVPTEQILYPSNLDYDWIDGKIRSLWTARGYGQRIVYQSDPDSGESDIIARDAGHPLVTVTSTFIYPAPELGGELAVSERSGWAQLYLITPDDPDGGIALTQGQWEVLSIERVDPEAKAIFVTGVGREADRNPYYRALYRVSLDGGAPVLLTPEPLDHDVTLSPDGRWFVDAISSPTHPTETVLRSTSDGRIIARLATADASALFATGYTPPEPFEGLAADGMTKLYGMIWRPADFDPTRSYPIIEQVYTGPTTTNVPVSWYDTIMANAGSVAQIGAIVVHIDGRGTSRRGQAFRSLAYQNLGEVGLDDHIGMIYQMAAKYPYIDSDRVGVFGGSAGGYDAARFVLRRPQFFKVAVASSGNHDLRLDKAWWPEVSMGNPAPEVWERNSNMSVAGNLVGKLLLIHGDIDDNVPVTESMRLAKALISAGRDVDIVILPNTTHRVAQPFFWRKLRDYFTRHLLDEKPPALPLPQPQADQSAAANP